MDKNELAEKIPFDWAETQPCPDCDGTGLVLNFEGTDDEPCDCCLGFGEVPYVFTKHPGDGSVDYIDGFSVYLIDFDVFNHKELQALRKAIVYGYRNGISPLSVLKYDLFYSFQVQSLSKDTTFQLGENWKNYLPSETEFQINLNEIDKRLAKSSPFIPSLTELVLEGGNNATQITA